MQNKQIALVFPGQGSQASGMGYDLYKNFTGAKEVFQEVDDALGFSLSKIIFEGTEEELRRTENTQPALMATSIATLRSLEGLSNMKASYFARVVAGHSLGEYSALVASGSLSLRDASIILRKRGEFMANAMPTGGAMLAVIGLDEAKLLDLIEASKGNLVLVVANDNANGQIVLSGNEEAILKAQSLSKEFGAKMAVKLEVSGPFHSPLLSKASEQMKEELSKYKIHLPLIPLINNVNADYYKEQGEMADILARQVVSRVRWRETMLKMKEDGITHAIEVGSGKVLCGLFKRTVKEIEAINVGNSLEIQQILNLIS
jgi:[acyl-carrier-protein] S-malonyltransferase